MAILLGVGIVALALLVFSGPGRHFGPGMFRSYGPGFLLWPIFAIVGAVVATAMGLLPIVAVIGGGYLVYRWITGRNVEMPALFGKARGAGGAPTEAEQGIFCPSCAQAVSREWATCPHCGYRKYVAPDLIQRRCSTCGTALKKEWAACPYCSTRIDEPALASAPGPAQPKGPGESQPVGGATTT